MSLQTPQTDRGGRSGPLSGTVRVALEDAMLRSELVRTGGLAITLFAFIPIFIVRQLLSGDTATGAVFAAGITLVAAASAFELVMFLLVRRSIRSGKRVPGWLGIAGLFVECNIPTLALIIALRGGALAPEQAITTPGLVAYAMFIILAILKMQPAIALLSGTICAAAYTSLAGFVLATLPEGAQFAIPLPYLFSYPLILFICGILAAFVTARVRAHLIAALVEAARREAVEQELQAASTIQQGLLPSDAPQVEGFTVAGWNRPADETGGDYFDWQVLPDGRAVIALADVTGHGLGPALVTAFCRAYARAIMQHEGHLHSALTVLNRLLSEDLPSGRFITFVAAILEPGSGDVPVLSAGHGPIVHLRASTGEVIDQAADAAPLGVITDFEFEPGATFTLEEGDSLVLLTDGFFEWPNPDGEMFGLERLRDSLRRHHREAPDRLIQCLLEDVESFSAGVAQPDDLTAVVVRRNAGA